MAAPRRSHLAIMALGWTVFAVYGSLVPLNYQPLTLDAALARFRDIQMLSLDIGRRADWVANILLFIPLTFLWMGALTADRGPAARIVTAVVLVPLAAAAALAIEFTQIWFPGRTVSQNDIAAESLGGAIGAVLWLVIGRELIAWLRSYSSERSVHGQWMWLLHTYVAGFAIFAVLPLDLTISVSDLYYKWQQGRVILIPFTYPYESLAVFVYQLASDIAVIAPVGAWFALARPRVGIRSPVVGTTIAAALIECVQLLVVSRFTDVTDVVVAPVGALIGVRLAARLLDTPAEPHRHGRVDARAWVPALGLIAAYSAFLVAGFLFPFEFTRDPDIIRDRLNGLVRVPFQALYRGTEFNAINQVLIRVLLFAPLGVLWARLTQTTAAPTGAARRLLVFAGLTYAAALAAGIELAQVLMPSKTADVTEVGLCLAGAVAGLMIANRLLQAPASAQWTSAAASPPRPAAAASRAAAAAPRMTATEPRVTPAAARWVYRLAVAALVVHATLATAGAYDGVPQPATLPASIFIVICVAALSAVPSYPVAGLLVYFALAYLTPRYGGWYETVLLARLLEASAVMACAGAWLSAADRRFEWRRPIWIAFALFIGWVFVSAGVAALGSSGDPDLFHRPVRFLDALALGVAAFLTLRRPADYATAMLGLAAVLAAQVFLFPSTVHLNNDLAAMLAIAIPATCGVALAWPAMGVRGAAVILLPALVYGLVMTENRGGAVGVVAAAVVFALAARRPLKAVLAVGTALGVAMVWFVTTGYWQRFAVLFQPGAENWKSQSRIQIWASAWNAARSNPIFGVGPGRYALEDSPLASMIGNVPVHNNFLGVLVETGWPGLIFYTTLFGAALALAWQAAVRAPEAWQRHAARGMAGAIAAYLTIGMFLTRQDLVLAYAFAGVVAGWTFAREPRVAEAPAPSARDDVRPPAPPARDPEPVRASPPRTSIRNAGAGRRDVIGR